MQSVGGVLLLMLGLEQAPESKPVLLDCCLRFFPLALYVAERA